MHQIVIAGAGLAGHRAAETLRRRGFDGDLTLVGDETHRPYDRPPLSKQLLAGSVEDDACFYPSDDLDVRWRLGEAAVGLDAERKLVRLAGGDELPFDGLVIATGRRAREWPTPIELDGVYTLRGLDDCLALRPSVTRDTKVAIIGAGFIGCEVASTLRGNGVESVTVVDIAPHPMPVLGPEVGARAAALHARHGVRLRLGASVAAFEGIRRVQAVRLHTGERLAADVVLLALGSVPNSEWLADSGLERFNGTVLCNEHCFAVGRDDIVAAGDIAAFPHASADRPLSIEHWSNAREMGEVAAANLLADPASRQTFVPVPTFWSDQYDVKIKSVGLIGLAERFTVVEEDRERPSLVVEAHRGDELVGAVVFNKNKKIIEYQRRLAEAVAA